MFIGIEDQHVKARSDIFYLYLFDGNVEPARLPDLIDKTPTPPPAKKVPAWIPPKRVPEYFYGPKYKVELEKMRTFWQKIIVDDWQQTKDATVDALEKTSEAVSPYSSDEFYRMMSAMAALMMIVIIVLGCVLKKKKKEVKQEEDEEQGIK